MQIGRLRCVVSGSSILFSLLSFVVLCGATTLHAAGVQQVSVFPTQIVLSGNLSAVSTTDTTLMMYELSAAASSSTDASAVQVAQVVVPAGRTTFTVPIPRLSGDHDRLYSKFVAMTSDQQTLGVPHYADDFEFKGLNDYPYPAASSIKGVGVLIEDDAEEIGTRQSTLNVLLSSFMLTGPGTAGTTISFAFNGSTYYFDQATILGLDHRVRILTQDGIQVRFIVLLGKNGSTNSAASILIHPDADLTTNGFFAFNTKTDEGVQYTAAAFAFLAQRYSRADKLYGRVVDYIIGNEVDSAYGANNMGQQSVTDYAEYYTRAVRLAYQAIRTAYTNPRVYISLDHFWTVTIPGGKTLEDYYGKNVFDQIASISTQEGNFPWNVAYHPYPQNLTDPYFWRDDNLATSDSNTKYITFKNIQVLSQYLELPQNTYEGQVRNISCSEEGVNLPQDPTLTAEQNEQVQAAAYAYAFYKLRFTPHIDSMVLYRQVTTASDNLRMSLWSVDPNRSGEAAGTPRQIYNMYKYIDTPESQSMSQFALPIIGIQSWNDAIPQYDSTQLATQPDPETQVGAEKFVTIGSPTVLSSFTDGADGWVYADNADTVQASSSGGYQGGGELTVSFNATDGYGETKFSRGAEVDFAQPVDASSKPYVTLALNVPVPQPGQFLPGNVFYAKIKVYGPNEQVAAGVVRLDPTQGWTPIALDLSHWSYRNQISKIKVWVHGTTDDNWIGTFAISQVALASSIGNPTYPNIDFQLSAVTPGAVGEAVSVTAINNGILPVNGVATAQECSQIGLSPVSFSLDVPPAGGTQSFPSTFSDYSSSASPAQVCFLYNGETVPAPVTLSPLPAATITPLYDFEDETSEGWSAGQNVASVAAVKSFVDGPTTPYHGIYALEATGTTAIANAPKSIVLTPSTPLNLSNAGSLTAFVDSYGLHTGDKFSAFITLTSGSQTLTTTLTTFQPNQWNQLTLDISHWAYRNNITKVEIGFENTSETIPWGPKFQVDLIGTYP